MASLPNVVIVPDPYAINRGVEALGLSLPPDVRRRFTEPDAAGDRVDSRRLPDAIRNIVLALVLAHI